MGKNSKVKIKTNVKTSETSGKMKTSEITH